jgi:hypothetical protein
MVFMFILMAGNSVYASDPGAKCQMGVPDFVLKAKDILLEPVTWIKWLAAVAAVLLISWGGLIIKTARGRTEKIESGQKFISYSLIGGFIIFSGSALAQWFFSKLGC